ncbi:unnamed protein product, partial [Allacma fusca]
MIPNIVSNSTDVLDSNTIRDPTSSDISLPSSPTLTEPIDDVPEISRPLHDPLLSNITTQATLPLISLRFNKLCVSPPPLPLFKKPPLPKFHHDKTPKLVKQNSTPAPVSAPVPLMTLNV